METFNVGDFYIHFTRYGGVNIDQVKNFGSVAIFDVVNKVLYNDYYIVNSKNIHLKLDGSDGRIFKVQRRLTIEEMESFKKQVEIVKKLKEERMSDVLSPFKEKIKLYERLTEEYPYMSHNWAKKNILGMNDDEVQEN